MEQFHFFHKTLNEINNIADVSEVNISPEQVILQFEQFSNKKFVDIKNNPELFGYLLLEVRKHCKLSLREMATFFDINKDKLNKYIHNVIDKN